MTKKVTVRIALVLCLMVALVGCLAACSNGGNTNGDNNTAATETAKKYVNEGSDYAIKTSELPSDYPLIAYDQFAEGFKAFLLDGGSITTSSTYADIVKLFGNEGIEMTGIKYEGYAYYVWCSDKDYLSDTKAQILVTFKVSGDSITYYAYSATGITADDVK